MTCFKRVLIVGTGPTSMQLAVNFKNNLNCEIGIAGRVSNRSKLVYKAIRHNDLTVNVHIQNSQHHAVEGTSKLDYLFEGYSTVKGKWDTIILSVTADAYISVLAQIDQKVLSKVTAILLISPTFGSNCLVANYFREINPSVEVISFSTYFGDTRWLQGEPSHEVVTTGVKKKVYIGSSLAQSERLAILEELYQQLHIQLTVMDSPLEAETRNISLYVHPPLFMNHFSLQAIFDNTNTPKYVYKLYPEGPITQEMIHHLCNHWQEIMDIIKKLNIKPLNLLKFMVDDNYPLHPESIARQDIEGFEQLPAIHQEYLLYVRYASLLIDPFSQPDSNGRYFDFSAVPIRKIFMNREGLLDIPRMPKEDYYRLKIIQGIAKAVQVECPTIDHFIQIYEEKLRTITSSTIDALLSDAFTVQTFSVDIEMICYELQVNSLEVHTSTN
ncbi:opine metallophore biosynthesis dehydrogenase [Lysinibacillus sp. FSL H8-0500]|uniref:opine metallophore biosynthesis dehydrogenase n=1 Tax=Lysinibacillus sp. FSL H8-0500 TaxID=2921393 RepID=UPI00310192F5